MSDRHDAARAALEAALAAITPGPGASASAASSDAPGRGPATEPQPARSARPASWQPVPGDPEADPRSRDGEPDPRDVARQVVLRQLAMGPRSRAQLRDKLRQKLCPDDIAEAVLDRMTEVGLVDDDAYAAMLVRSQQVGRGLAKRALARELRTKGVDADTAAAALSQVDPQGEEDLARRLVAKRLRTMHGLDATVQTRRLAGMLARKGYSSELSLRVIREAIRESPEHQRD